MSVLLTRLFPIAGAGMLAIEAVLVGLMVGLFWSAYPKGFSEIGTVLGLALLGCWLLAYSLARRVKATASSKLEGRARVALVIGAVLGVTWSLMGFLSGPHLAGVAVYGIGAQVLVLLTGRLALAI